MEEEGSKVTGDDEEDLPGVDGGPWAWLTMIGCFFSMFLSGVFTYSASIFHIELTKTFQKDSSYTSFIGALFSSLLYLLGPVSSTMINLTSCRFTHCVGGFLYFLGFSLSFFATTIDHLLITYGIIGGIGTGLVATAHLVVPAFRFRKYLGFIVGIQVTGAGISLMATGPIVQGLIDYFGLRGAFLVLGAIGSHQIFFGLLMKPSILEIRSKQINHKKYDQDTETTRPTQCCKGNVFQFNIFRRKAFLMILLGTFIWHIPSSVLQLHLLNYAVTEGSTVHQAVIILTTIGVSNTLGRVLTGVFLGDGQHNPLLLEFGMLGVLGIVTLLYPSFSGTFLGQQAYAVIYGIYIGGLVTLFSPICFHYLDMDQISTGVGLRYCIGGVAVITGPTIAGLILDLGGSYALSFYISGSLLIVGALMDLLSALWQDDHSTLTTIKDGRVLSQSLHSLHIDRNSLNVSVHSIHQDIISLNRSLQSLHRRETPPINRSLRSLRFVDEISQSSDALHDKHHSQHLSPLLRQSRDIQSRSHQSLFRSPNSFVSRPSPLAQGEETKPLNSTEP